MTSDTMPPRLDRCRSCGAEIIWLTMASGRRMPINPEPSPAGNVVADLVVAVGAVLSTTPGAAKPAGPLYLSHFATCPQGKTWRRS